MTAVARGAAFLRDLDRSELRDLVTQIAPHPEQWRALVRRGTAARAFEQLWRDEHVDVWVISWTNGSDTGELRHFVGDGFDFDAEELRPVEAV